MWHPDESVELAALQMTNILFSVPQVSMRLREISKPHLQMIRFYTDYWKANRSVLLDGSFQARSPAANYPILVGTSPEKTIFGLYENQVVRLDSATIRPAIDIVNGFVIEENGYFYDQSDVTNIGYWSWKKLAEVLPYDYLPVKEPD